MEDRHPRFPTDHAEPPQRTFDGPEAKPPPSRAKAIVVALIVVAAVAVFIALHLTGAIHH